MAWRGKNKTEDKFILTEEIMNFRMPSGQIKIPYLPGLNIEITGLSLLIYRLIHWMNEWIFSVIIRVCNEILFGLSQYKNRQTKGKNLKNRFRKRDFKMSSCLSFLPVVKYWLFVHATCRLFHHAVQSVEPFQTEEIMSSQSEVICKM